MELFVFSAMLVSTVALGDDFVNMFVFSALLGSTLDLLCFFGPGARHLGVLDQKNSCCGMFMTGFTGCAAPRAVSVSTLRRPVMLGVMAGMDQDDSYCGMYKTGYAGCDAPVGL